MKIKGLVALMMASLLSGSVLADVSPVVVRTLHINSIEAATPQGQLYGIGSLQQAVCSQKYGSYLGDFVPTSEFQVGAEVTLAGEPVSLHPTGMGLGQFMSDGAKNEQTGLQMLNLDVQGGSWVMHAIYPSDSSNVVGHSYSCILVAN